MLTMVAAAAEQVGPENVVQVCMDNSAACKRAGDLIMER
jgi:hypothetical protein